MSQEVTAAEGGTIVITEEMSPALAGLELVISPGALEADQKITIGEVVGALPPLPEDHVSLGYRLSFEPAGLSFRTPVTLRITFPAEVWQAWSSLTTSEEVLLMRYEETSGRWIEVPAQFHAGTLSADIFGFSFWDVVLFWRDRNPASDEKIREQARRWRHGQDVEPWLRMKPFLDHGAFRWGTVSADDRTFADAIGALLLAEAMWNGVKSGNFYAASSYAEEVLQTLPQTVLKEIAKKLLGLPTVGLAVGASAFIIETTVKHLLEVMKAGAFDNQLKAYLSWRGWFFEGGNWTPDGRLGREHDVVVSDRDITTGDGWFYWRQFSDDTRRTIAYSRPPGANPKDLFDLGNRLYDLLHKADTTSRVCWVVGRCLVLNGLEKDRAWLEHAFRGWNKPPRVSIANPGQAVPIGKKVTLVGSAEDLEEDPMVHRWAQTDGPAVKLDYPWSFEPEFTPTEAGVYTFELVVYDLLVENRSTATVTIEVTGADVGRVPTVATGQATNVTATSATLNATVNPNGLGTSAHFEWGTSTTYGNRTPTQSVDSGTSNVPVSANLTGLSPNTTYHFRVVATNSAGTSTGSGASFRTAPTPSFDFAISATPSSGTVTQGASIPTTVRAWRTAEPTTRVSFSIVGLPTEVTADPASWSWDLGDQNRSVMFTVGANALVGTYTVTIQGTGGGVTREATFTLTVTAAGRRAAGQIAFTSYRDGNNEIYVMNADGTSQRNLTDHLAWDWYPAWSPDGTRIAFASGRDGNSEIHVMNADGSNPRNLTNHPGEDLYPAWSPDGRRIAFVSWRDGNQEIYVMNADGSNQRNLTNHPASDGYPAWSPDGTKIAFAAYRDYRYGYWEIYVMNADGTNQRNLTNHPASDGFPAWSPDGTKIAFASGRDGNWEIYVMSADGTNQRNLTNHPASDGFPAWSPDGTKIAFMSDLDGGGDGEICVMNADGSNQRNLTNHPAHDWGPAWSPIAP